MFCIGHSHGNVHLAQVRQCFVQQDFSGAHLAISHAYFVVNFIYRGAFGRIAARRCGQFFGLQYRKSVCFQTVEDGGGLNARPGIRVNSIGFNWLGHAQKRRTINPGWQERHRVARVDIGLSVAT